MNRQEFSSQSSREKKPHPPQPFAQAPPQGSNEERTKPDDRSRSATVRQMKFTERYAATVEGLVQDGHRVFKAWRDYQYTGPKETSTSSLPTEKHPNRYACYVGPDGSIYDQFYVPIEYSLPDTETFSRIPDPNEYFNYYDYEQALLDWHMKVEATVKVLRLPNVLGRFYSRPRIGSFAETSASEEIVFKAMADSESKGKSGEKSEKADSEEDKTDFQFKVEEFNFDEELWEAILVPEEPSPDLYTTYEQYEEALVRWAALCNEKLRFIPPHASQLHNLIPIHYTPIKSKGNFAVSNFNENEVLDDAVKVTSKRKLLAGVHIYVPFFEPMDLGVIRVSIPPFPEAQQSQWSSLSPETQNDISTIFRSLANKVVGMEAPEKTTILRTVSLPLMDEKEFRGRLDDFWKTMIEYRDLKARDNPSLPRIHGTLPKAFSKPSAKSKMAPLRRTDLTTPFLTIRCYDCPTDIGSTTVEFQIPDYDIENFDYKRLCTDPSYMKEVSNQIQQHRHAGRLDHLNSWYHPTVSPKVIEQHRKEILDILAQRPLGSSTLSTDQLCAVLSGRMYLDQFQVLMAESIEDEDGHTKTYFNELLSSVTQHNFHSILQLFESHSNVLVHAKVSAFCVEFLQDPKARQILEQLAKNQDIETLSRVAYALHFNSEIPKDIYPYRKSIVKTIEAAFGTMGLLMTPITKQVFIVYYITLINEVVSKQPAYVSPGLNAFITETKKSAIENLGAALQGKGMHLRTWFASGLGHRSSTVAYFIMFLIVQLMNNTESPALQAFLRQTETAFVYHIRKLCSSKFYHAQFIAKRLFARLQEPLWIDIVYQHYNSDPRHIKEDLLPHPNFYTSSSFISTLVLNLCSKALKDVTNDPSTIDKIGFLMNPELFHFLLDEVIKEKPPFKTSKQHACEALALLSKTYFRLGLLASTKSKTKKQSKYLLQISPEDLTKTLNWIHDVPSVDSNGALLKQNVAIKNSLLEVVRHLLKDKDIFEIVRKATDFYQKLISFCQNTSSLEFNGNGWHLVYQMIRYHPGQLDLFINKYFNSLIIDTIQTNASNIIIINGLHYIRKMFNLLNTEQKRISEGKLSSRGEKDTKSIQKDIKALNAYFVERSVFIKFHMLYKKFLTPPEKEKNPTGKPYGTYPGRPFQELAELYNMIASSPHCSKIMKDVQKKPEYREGVLAIYQMKNPNTTATAVLPPVPMKHYTGNLGSLLPATSPGKDKVSLSIKK